MPDDPILLYWDAGVFLAYINGETERLKHLDAFLDPNGKEGQIHTSMISIVEVAFGKAEQDGKVLEAEIEKKINRLWAPASPIRLVEFHALIAEGAKDLMRYALTQGQGWKLKPMDAIHLSTARNMAVKQIHTYDEGWDKYGTYLGIPIGRPIAKAPKLL